MRAEMSELYEDISGNDPEARDALRDANRYWNLAVSCRPMVRGWMIEAP